MSVHTGADPSTPSAGRATRGAFRAAIVAALLTCGFAGSARAQAPWIDWYGPPADGMYGLRFGMDPASADEALAPLGLRRASGRVGSLRYEGKLDGVPAELVCDFLPDAAGATHQRLYRIAVLWNDVGGGTRRPLALFRTLDARLSQRYDRPKHTRDATEGTLSTGAGYWLRVYQGVEMHAQLDLRSRGPERYYVRLVLDYPQLHPEMAER